MEIYKLLYKVDKNKSHIRLLGKIFLNKNKFNGYFIYKNKKIRLTDRIKTENNKEEELKIYLVFHKSVNNKFCMFMNCTSLLKVSLHFQEKKQARQ